ncbi:MAG: molybdopterin-dependent oxidoreductase, partial [Chloroflexota bacterium]
PGDIARLAMAVAGALDADAPAPEDIGDDVQALADEIASALREAERPVVISGTGCGSPSVMRAAANVAWALQGAGVDAALSYALPEANSMGVAMLGGADLEAAREKLAEGQADTLIILENDLYRRAEPDFVDDLLRTATRVVALDYLPTATTERADLVLPAATFAEGDGTLVNQEGRAQRYLQVFVPEETAQADGRPILGVRESWRWLQDMMTEEDGEQSWQDLHDVLAALAEDEPGLAAVIDLTPPAEFRLVEQKVPRQPHRYSGRTAMRAHINVSEPKPPEDADAPMNFSMEGFKGQPPGSLLPRYWAPGWNSVQALNKFQQEVGGPLRGGDPGVRLIEPTEDAAHSYFGPAPESFSAREGQLLLTPLYHIYGSEELSPLTPAVAELSATPYVALNSAEAERLQLAEGDLVSVELGAETMTLPLHINPSLPAGVAGLPVGLPEMPYVKLPGWGRVSPGEGGQT